MTSSRSSEESPNDWVPEGGELVVPGLLVEIDELTGGVEIEDQPSGLLSAIARIATEGAATDEDVDAIVAAVRDDEKSADPTDFSLTYREPGAGQGRPAQ